MSHPQPYESDHSSPSDFGDPRVNTAMARLAAVNELSGSDQVAVYEAAHHALQDTLATIEEG